MQALSIANAATAPQALPCATGASTAVAAADNPADSGALPFLAQLVREILVRTTTQDTTQPAHTSRASGSAISAPSDSPLPAPSHETPSEFPPLLDPASLNLLWSFSVNPALVQPLLAAPPAASPTQTAPASKPCDSAAGLVSAIASDSQPGSSCSTSVAPAAGTSTPLSTTQATIPLSLPTLEIQLPDTQSSPATNPSVPFTSPVPAKSVVVDPSQINESNQPISPAARKAVNLEIVSNIPSTFAGVPISSLAPQIASLQPVSPTNVHVLVPSSANPHSAAVQSTAKTTLAPAVPSVIPLSTLETALSTSPKNAQLAHPETQPAISSANPSSMNQSSSQDNSSDNLDAQKTPVSPTAPNTTASHEASNFAQALVNASNTTVKPDVTPTPTSQPPTVSPLTAPSNERLTQPAAAPSPAPQANSSQTVFRSLDTTATSTVSDAQISQSSGHSEMRIAMQTDKFGAVELHTRVAGDEIGAAITVEKRDAHAALSVELPALQQALSEKQFRVDQITLLHSPLHSTTGDASGQPQSQGQQGDRRTSREPSLSFAPDGGSAFLFSQTATEPSGIFDSRGRLSVQA